jgi:hypothetical protein
VLQSWIMGADRLALYTTAYPAVERFLADWYGSVVAQSDREFDLWIGLDGLSPERVLAGLGSAARVTWVHGRAGESPAGLRGRAMECMTREYDGIVFADSDDRLEPGRIADARAALVQWDVYACALRIMDEAGHDLGVVFEPPADADVGSLLPRYNVFGLSNSAYRAPVLRNCLPLPAGCVLADWMLATRAWLGGARMDFDRRPGMWYRQYGQNVARVVGPFSSDDVRAAARLVIEHYRLLLSGGAPMPAPEAAALHAARARVERFQRAVTSSDAVCQRYVEALNRLPTRYVWWWCVAHPELEALWSN